MSDGSFGVCWIYVDVLGFELEFVPGRKLI